MINLILFLFLCVGLEKLTKQNKSFFLSLNVGLFNAFISTTKYHNNYWIVVIKKRDNTIAQSCTSMCKAAPQRWRHAEIVPF